MKSKKASFLILTAAIIAMFFACGTEKPVNTVSITEGEHIGTPHFIIKTETATYYLEKNNGGLSSIMDTEGTDWVQFSKSEKILGAAGAAADFRGLPNMVYLGEQGGVGHPGFDQCVSEQVNDTMIRVTSHSGNYVFSYAFTNDYAVMNIEKADTSRGYWVLYEGPIAGKFSPKTHICVTNEGYHPEQPSIYGDTPIKGNFTWMCFGDEGYDKMFYVEHTTPDTLIDIVYYMGSSGPELGNDSPDGMVVMGYGRTPDTKPLMRVAPNTFKFGFIDKPDVPKEQMKEAIEEQL